MVVRKLGETTRRLAGLGQETEIASCGSSSWPIEPDAAESTEVIVFMARVSKLTNACREVLLDF
jgi:hypothetical protein